MKSIKTWLTTIVLLLCSLTVSAHSFEVDGIYYKITSSTDLTVAVTYKGNSEVSYREYSGSITIPTTVTYGGLTYSVTSIGYQAFSWNKDLFSITIPESVTSIESFAFYLCRGLTNINIYEGVTSIGKSAFCDCSSLTSIAIPKSVSTIGSSAFAGCNEIESIYALNTKAITCDESIFATDAYNNAILYVPSDRVFEYEKATPWNKFQIEPMNKFTMTYMVDGEVYENIEMEYGAEITLPENPEKEGYTFMGWSEVPETMPANDITIYGSFAINKYLVTFKVDDEVIASDSLEYGASIVIPEAPEKEGYTFNGWGENETVPAGDVTYEGNYSVNSYKLTFIVDGEIVQESSVDYGTTITLPEAPEKEGYTFDGWANVPETVPACNLTFEGGYTANEYLLAFVVDGALYEMHKVRCDEKITALDMAEREGCTFVWENWIDKMPAKDYTVRGKYVPNKYAITYVADGEIVVTDSIAYGTAIEALKEPVKEGYTFSGWSEVPETMPAKDVIVIGGFTVNNYTVTYIVDGEVYKTESITYGSTITAAESPVKEGHTFSGWRSVPSTMPAKDVTVSGSFTINTYTITYIVNGELYKTESYTYGSVITAESPVKEGHTFSGWKEVPEIMPAEDVIVSGTFIVNQYLVTFKIGDEVIFSESMEYGSTIVLPEAPEREGYTFDGWGEVAETVPAGDVAYEGSYTVNTYKVYYYVGDVLVHTAEVAYGESIPEYVYEPTAEGDEFMGWAGETYETMPAHDVTYTANITNDISQSTIGNSQLSIYDLNGRKIKADDLRELEKGIYIVNGKKVMIK